MAQFADLPAEIISYIGEFCHWKQPTFGPTTSPRWHTGNLNALSRTCRGFHDILNPLLYRVNIARDSPCNSCVAWAAHKGRLATIQRAREYADVDLEADGTSDDARAVQSFVVAGRATALHIAIRHGHEDIVSYLLDNGANVHAPARGYCGCYLPPDDISYPLHTAMEHAPMKPGGQQAISHSGTTVINPNMAVIERLTVQGGAYLVAPDMAALPVFENRLPDSGPLIEQLTKNEAPQAKAASLRYTVEFNKPELFTRLMNTPGIDLSAADHKGWTALHLAADEGHASFVKALLQAGAPPNQQDNDLRTPLHMAAWNGNADAMECLLNDPEAKADARDEVNDATPLHYAARSGNGQCVLLLLARPETDASLLSFFDETALHFAVGSQEQASLPAIIHHLVEHGAPVNQVGGSVTALTRAIQHRLHDTALALIACGADPLTPDVSTIWTLLHECLRFPAPGPGQRAVTAALIAKGMDVNAFAPEKNRGWYNYDGQFIPRDLDPAQAGCTPLFIAATGARDVECMRLLLAAGASTTRLVDCRHFREPPDDDDAVGPDNNEVPFLAAFFRVLWNCENVPSDDTFEAASDRILLLLAHGASIDRHHEGEQSALRYACLIASEGGKIAPLKFLLAHADKTHVSLAHVEEILAEFGVRSEKKPASRQVLDLVRAFADREFPERSTPSA